MIIPLFFSRKKEKIMVKTVIMYKIVWKSRGSKELKELHEGEAVVSDYDSLLKRVKKLNIEYPGIIHWIETDKGPRHQSIEVQRLRGELD